MTSGTHQLLMITVAAAVTASACTQSTGVTESDIEERRIAPIDANARVTEWRSNHVIWVRSPRLSQRILLLLPGTNGAPGVE